MEKLELPKSKQFVLKKREKHDLGYESKTTFQRISLKLLTDDGDDGGRDFSASRHVKFIASDRLGSSPSSRKITFDFEISSLNFKL